MPSSNRLSMPWIERSFGPKGSMSSAISAGVLPIKQNFATIIQATCSPHSATFPKRVVAGAFMTSNVAGVLG